MTPTPPDKDELREWIKSKIDPKTGMIAVSYAELVDRIEALLQSQTNQAVLEAEARVRYAIHKTAPSVDNRKWHDYDAFINSIWLHWSIENKARINADGTATLRQELTQEVQTDE